MSHPQEAKDPPRAVPRAIILEFCLVGVVYIGAAVGLLFLCPYWLLDVRSPLPSAFEYAGVIWGRYIVTIGPLAAITNLQMLNLYQSSRILYRMAKDGLFSSWFLIVDENTGVPRNSVIFLGIVIAFFSLLFDLSYVVKVTVLLMLMGYIVLACALIKLRIRLATAKDKETANSKESVEKNKYENNYSDDKQANSAENSLIYEDNEHEDDFLQQMEAATETAYDMTSGDEEDPLTEMFRSDSVDRRGVSDLKLVSNAIKQDREWRSLTYLTSAFAPGIISLNVLIVLHFLSAFTLAVLLNYGWQDIAAGRGVAVMALMLLSLLVIVFSTLLGFHCGSTQTQGFQVCLFVSLQEHINLCCFVFFSLLKQTRIDYMM